MTKATIYFKDGTKCKLQLTWAEWRRLWLEGQWDGKLVDSVEVEASAKDKSANRIHFS